MTDSRKPRALAIAPQPFFTPRGTPFSVYYRSLVMAEAGVQIDLLTYGQGEDVDIPGVRVLRIPAFRWLGPVKVGPSFLKAFLDIFMVLKAIRLLCVNRYDFVHAHEEAVFFCVLLKPLFGFKLVYDMHSSLPQQLSNFQFTSSRVWTGLFRRLEDISIRRADAVITICPALAEYVLARVPDGRKHFLIENSIFDPVRLAGASPCGGPAAGPVPLPAEIPAGRRAVVYCGTMEPYQGLDILIGCFREVREIVPQAFLVLVGGTPAQVAACREDAVSHGVADHCLVVPRVSQSVAREYCARADVLVSPRSAGTNTPLKTYEQLAGGVPIVATRIRSHTQVLDDGVAYLVAPEPRSMAAGVIAALRDGRDRNPRAMNAAKLYRERYSRKVYEKKIRDLLETLSCAASRA